jgi:hypothetical protein
MFVADLMAKSKSLIFCETSGCGKLSIFFSDRCEVGYFDVVAEASRDHMVLYIDRTEIDALSGQVRSR